ncbi:AAA family ATPase [Arthrobacter roseus]|uniref:AAA family ATPase n=1 Tax=Arthrobacter roseus TaxID=136274 RepID=UPI001963A4DD|nr:MoxR family ATPase [Arthrobacter roseus]MBM7849035.1 MoxR-like ATPase [Arthrobacter roseus]
MRDHENTSIDVVAQQSDAVLTELANVVVDMRQPLRLALAAVLAGGHVLFEDMPGLGKTLAAKSMAQTLGLHFDRLQCTPDLLPSDITGSSIFDPSTRTFDFRPGPVFTGLFLADEINRTSPKTQSALLEAMAERQVSVEGRTLALEAPFHVFATANPIEFEGTYPLPEAQLDRFLIRLAIGYPDTAAETEIISRRLFRGEEASHVRRIIEPGQLLAMQQSVEATGVNRDIIDYAVRLTAATREHTGLDAGASPRGSQALVLMGRALAAIDGRDYVLPEDIKAVAVPVLAHRLTLTPTSWARGVRSENVVRDILTTVQTPTTAAADGS